MYSIDTKTGIHKCLWVVRDNVLEKNTIGSAALSCALKDSRLVSLNTCQDIQLMMSTLETHYGIQMEQFWFGMFAPGKNFTRKGHRNFVNDGKHWLLDS